VSMDSVTAHVEGAWMLGQWMPSGHLVRSSTPRERGRACCQRQRGTCRRKRSALMPWRRGVCCERRRCPPRLDPADWSD
jgi:hypothetical protein